MRTDPVGDMIAQITNAIRAGHDRVEIPASRVKAGICKTLKDEGFIKSFKIIAKAKNDISIKILLKENALEGLKRVSTPGLRIYSSYDNFPRVLSGLGISIISTSKGIISSRAAKRLKVGGEVICNAW